MHAGFQQGLLILYILLIAVGPKRVTRWVRRGQALSARLRRKPLPKPGRYDVLRLFEMFEERALVGWGIAVVGLGLLFAGFFSAYIAAPGELVPVLYVAAVGLMVFAMLLI